MYEALLVEAVARLDRERGSVGLVDRLKKGFHHAEDGTVFLFVAGLLVGAYEGVRERVFLCPIVPVEALKFALCDVVDHIEVILIGLDFYARNFADIAACGQFRTVGKGDLLGVLVDVPKC